MVSILAPQNRLPAFMPSQYGRIIALKYSLVCHCQEALDWLFYNLHLQFSHLDFCLTLLRSKFKFLLLLSSFLTSECQERQIFPLCQVGHWLSEDMNVIKINVRVYFVIVKPTNVLVVLWLELMSDHTWTSYFFIHSANIDCCMPIVFSAPNKTKEFSF